MSVRWNRSLVIRLFASYLFALVALAGMLHVYSGRAVEDPFGSVWLGGSVGVAALVVLYPVLRSYRRSRRLRRLTDFSMAVTDGTAPPPLQPDGDDLLGRLEGNMLVMAKSVNARLQAAHEEQRKLAAVLSGMAEGVLVVDRSGIIRLSNHCADRIFATGPAGILVGEPLLKVSRDPDLQDLVQEVTNGEASRHPAREITFNGGSRSETFRVTATPIPQPDGKPELFILVFHDVTELKKLEAIRRDFVANVSHEIRTPLTAIRGYAETLREGALNNPELAGKFMEVIERHSERLTRLTDDLLTLSDLELGRTALRRTAVSLPPAVDAAINLMRGKAEHREVEIRCEVPADLPPLCADPDRVEQVLLNLVDNAVKYTPAGGRVRVSARTARPPHIDATAPPSEGGPHAWIEISVSDTGIGIPSHDLPRLTERFYRVDKARSRELGGTGLGLAIVKHIVSAHGGALRIESELGHGTRVSVYLPAAEAESLPVMPAPLQRAVG
ncbi:MAG: sensor histidine kinase [Candidatus Binatia bacterium]